MVVGYILLGWLGWAWAALGEGGQYNGTHALCTSDLLVTYNVEVDRLDYVVLVYVHVEWLSSLMSSWLYILSPRTHIMRNLIKVIMLSSCAYVCTCLVCHTCTYLAWVIPFLLMCTCASGNWLLPPRPLYRACV